MEDFIIEYSFHNSEKSKLIFDTIALILVCYNNISMF